MANSRKSPLVKALRRARTNPLLLPLPKRMNLLQLAVALTNQPITPANLQGIPMAERLELVSQFSGIVVGTDQTLEISDSLQAMIHEGLKARDPRDVLSRTFIYESGKCKGSSISKLEWWPTYALGMVIDGITGVGKTQIVARLLSLYPQVIEHGENPECGWKYLKQLVHLTVHMPSDGSRGGFLENGFRALDLALGTTYTEEYSAVKWTVERKLVVFLHLLAVHRCGVLIIEESQERNLNNSPFGAEFLTFFLRILNWGVPTVLIGNPMAFSLLKTFSQDVDRFSEGGWFHLMPQFDPGSEDWLEGWMPGLWAPTLLDVPDAEFEKVKAVPEADTWPEFIWRRTAGVPRYISRLRREVQGIALSNGVNQITSSFVEGVYQSSTKMQALHGRIDAFVRRDWKALQTFTDIPWRDFYQTWKDMDPNQVEKANGTDATSDQGPPKKSSSAKKRMSAGSGKASRSTKKNPVPSGAPTAQEVADKEFQESMVKQIGLAVQAEPRPE